MKQRTNAGLNIARRFLRDSKGASPIEYALIATIVGVGIIVGLRAIPEALNTLFNTVGGELK